MAAAARICYNHVLFLLEPVHALLHPTYPKTATMVVFAGTGEPFCYNHFWFLLLPVFLWIFATSIFMTCEFATLFFASTSHCFCWNHQAFLLELAIFPWVRVRKHFSSVGSASHFFYNRRAVSASTNIFFFARACVFQMQSILLHWDLQNNF